jgi:ureidoacrylate peracid hydrolase
LHKVAIPDWALERVMTRRGKPYAFDQLDPKRTALIVVDLQNGFMSPGQPAEVPVAREIVDNVNTIGAAVRAAGGLVVFTKHTFDAETAIGWSVWRDHFATGDWGNRMEEAFTSGHYGHQLWSGLEVGPDDLAIQKYRFSALVPGSSNLDAILRRRGIDTIIVTGTVTNVCCESTTRDAMMMNYKCIMVSDANAALTDEEHNATLVSMMARFSDVRSTAEVVALLGQARNAPTG